MSVDIQIVGAGAYVAPAGASRRRPYTRGQILTVEDDVAESLIAHGVARYPGDVEDPVESTEPVLDDEATDEQLADAKVDDLIAFVGDDEDRAARVLALEEAKGDKARSTLIASLKDKLGEGEGA